MGLYSQVNNLADLKQTSGIGIELEGKQQLWYFLIYYYNNIYYLYRNFSKKEFPLLLHPWKMNVTDLRKVYIIIMYSTYIIILNRTKSWTKTLNWVLQSVPKLFER